MNRQRRNLNFFIDWLVIAIIGWVAYALLRGLAAIIYLGVAFYDWQWYLPVIAVIVGLPLYILWSRLHYSKLPIGRSARVIFAILSFWIVIGYSGFGQVVQLNPANSAPVSISFWAFSDLLLTPDFILKDIQAAQGAIYLYEGTRPFEHEGRAAFVIAMRRLADYHIPVYWAVPATDFLSAPVAAQWVANVRRAAQLAAEENLINIRGFIGDIEPPVNWPYDWLGSDISEFDSAVNGYRQLLTDLHRAAPTLRVGVTATWAHFFDALDGDADLSIVMRSPLDPPGGWDFVNLMTYSSYYPESWRPYYVYVLERAMARLDPTEQASHLLGLVGGGMPGEPIMSFDELVRDARISRALEVREIAVFQLDGALRVFGADVVHRLNGAVNGEGSIGLVNVPFARPVSILFYGIAVGDALLDVLHSQTGWFMLWLILSGILAWRITQRRSLTLR